MMTTEQYFRKPHTPKQEADAQDLLNRRNALRAQWTMETGRTPPIDQDTDSEISGVERGDGDGGFRTPGSRTGAAGSSHRHAKGVDDYDPDNAFDTWLDTFEDGKGGNSMLERHGLYREHPSATPGWCHLTTRAPGSGKRTFYP